VNLVRAVPGIGLPAFARAGRARGRALARLFVSKSAELGDNYGIEWEITGVATRRMGWRASDEAIEGTPLLAGNDETRAHNGIDEWLAAAKPDVVFETTSLTPETGQPAIDYLRAALQVGAHTITANQAPIVYAYDELNEIAVAHGKRFFVILFDERAHLLRFRIIRVVIAGR
jgi:homoserine dehydrogenase